MCMCVCVINVYAVQKGEETSRETVAQPNEDGTVKMREGS